MAFAGAPAVMWRHDHRSTFEWAESMNTGGPSTPVLFPSQASPLAFLRSLKWKEQLARALGVSYAKHLRYYLFRIPVRKRYVTFEIPKRDGSKRLISSPDSGLKIVQQRLSSFLYDVYGGRSPSHGFAQNRDILTNASEHLRRRYVLNIDLEDFFGSINFGRVRGMFLGPPYLLTPEVATVLAQICCHENRLPQGAPTSPIISNMICGRLDAELKRLAKNNGCVYTRYADDLTFSTRAPAFPSDLARRRGDTIEVGAPLNGVITSNGFKIKSSKTRLLTRSDRQEVTGVTVNREPNVRRTYIRSIRGAIHAMQKYGPAKAQEKFEEKYSRPTKGPSPPKLERVLFGKIQFVGHIRGRDDVLYRKLRDELMK